MAVDTGCRATVDIRVCSLSVDTSLYPVTLPGVSSVLRLKSLASALCWSVAVTVLRVLAIFLAEGEAVLHELIVTSGMSKEPASLLNEFTFKFALSPNMYIAQAAPATRPKTTQSRRELPPNRLLPCASPATSPAAYRLRIASQSEPKTTEFSSISKPPMQ